MRDENGNNFEKVGGNGYGTVFAVKMAPRVFAESNDGYLMPGDRVLLGNNEWEIVFTEFPSKQGHASGNVTMRLV